MKCETHKIQKLLYLKIHLYIRLYIGIDKKSPRRDSNPQPPEPKSDALSIAPLGLCYILWTFINNIILCEGTVGCCPIIVIFIYNTM